MQPLAPNGRQDTGLVKNGNSMKYTDILKGVQEHLTQSTTLPQPMVEVKLSDDGGDIHHKESQPGVVDKRQIETEADSQRKKIEELRPKNLSDQVPTMGETEASDSIEEYKKDFLEMNIGSLNAIMNHSKAILESLDNESVKSNLTESWLQGKIAITEDYMRTIHDFVKYVPSDDDEEDMAPASLWENIRKKKLREGKNYKPAKPGDKDRPDPDAWKKAQK